MAGMRGLDSLPAFILKEVEGVNYLEALARKYEQSMNDNVPAIEELTDQEDVPYNLLQLADPSTEMIRQYLQTGRCFVARLDGSVIGVTVLTEIAPQTMEIKNIAVASSFQGQGFGKQLLRFAESFSRESGYTRLLIGTGNSSIAQLSLYQKEGFEIVEIRKDFFIKNYDAPIVENGILCKHMIVLEKDLTINLT
jgi:ribosomal protein S18 acetylase RimI-like enzyme